MKLRDWLFLLLLGVVSAIISVAMPLGFGDLMLAGQGAVFGTAICVFLLDQQRLAFFPDALAVIGASTVACWASFYGAFWSAFIPWPGRLPRLPLPFAGGLVGGLVLLTALFALAFPKCEILRKVTFGTVLSGLLGVVGYVSAPVLGHALWRLFPNGTSPEYLGTQHFWNYSAFFVWQVCMAIYIGFATQPSGLVSKTQSPLENAGRNSESWAATRSTPPQKTATNALVAVLGVSFAVVMVFSFRNRRERAVGETFERSVWAQMPSIAHLADVPRVPAEEVLVLNDIGPLQARLPQITDERVVDLPNDKQPNSIRYLVEYAPDRAVGMAALTVSVTEYPNEEWPQFLAKYELPLGLQPTIKPLTEKFGNKVRTDAALYSQEVYPFTYEWPSGKSRVEVTYEPGIQREQGDQVMKIYLEKYPSAIR